MATLARINLSLTEPQLAFLRIEAERLGVTVGELLRRVIDQYREQREQRAA